MVLDSLFKPFNCFLGSVHLGIIFLVFNNHKKKSKKKINDFVKFKMNLGRNKF
jgi:hypothetical protein